MVSDPPKLKFRGVSDTYLDENLVFATQKLQFRRVFDTYLDENPCFCPPKNCNLEGFLTLIGFKKILVSGWFGLCGDRFSFCLFVVVQAGIGSSSLLG